ncbi:MAG: hypothetical protein ACFFEA_11870 [Candidatus Thorarchaeota archaeon]
MVSSNAAVLALVFLIIGVIFLPLKLLRKDLENSNYRLLYKVHVNAPKLALILAFVHGLTQETINPPNVPTGWTVGIVLVALAVLGGVISIKRKSEPLDDQGDAEWKTARVVKWVLTIVIVLVLTLHYAVFF